MTVEERLTALETENIELKISMKSLTEHLTEITENTFIKKDVVQAFGKLTANLENNFFPAVLEVVKD